MDLSVIFLNKLILRISRQRTVFFHLEVRAHDGFGVGEKGGGRKDCACGRGRGKDWGLWGEGGIVVIVIDVIVVVGDG